MPGRGEEKRGSCECGTEEGRVIGVREEEETGAA